MVYASMYIYGLQKLYGKRHVSFNPIPFKNLIQDSDHEDFDHYFAFFENQTKRRYIVDFRDKNTFNVNALHWSDVYAKVNFNSQTDEYKDLSENLKIKIIPIGPHFGINLHSSLRIYLLFFYNYFLAKSLLNYTVSIRTFMSGYNWLRRRSFIQSFSPSKARLDYVFHLSSLYKNQVLGDKTNEMRAIFVRASRRAVGVQFEGGLVQRNGDLENDYSDVVVNLTIPHKFYLGKIKESKFVFSTPAAWGCHGWKLGEYFALGKAIISTPFYNDIPLGIKHGENIHIAGTKDEIYEAVNLINSNDDYRAKLEKGAIDYYNNYIEPSVVVRRILGQLSQ